MKQWSIMNVMFVSTKMQLVHSELLLVCVILNEMISIMYLMFMLIRMQAVYHEFYNKGSLWDNIGKSNFQWNHDKE